MIFSGLLLKHLFELMIKISFNTSSSIVPLFPHNDFNLAKLCKDNAQDT